VPKIIRPKELGAPLGMYSHAMSAPAGEIVVVAGQVGTLPDGRIAGDDVGAQTKQALANVRTVLDAAGCSPRDVIRLQTFLTRADDIPGFMKARGEVFPDFFPERAYPPNTLLIVSGLVRPELRVEIEAMAVKPARRAAAPPKKAAARNRARRGSSASARRR